MSTMAKELTALARTTMVIRRDLNDDERALRSRTLDHGCPNGFVRKRGDLAPRPWMKLYVHVVLSHPPLWIPERI
eukprot:12917730-Prorocentrum_lima.AAC.1